jgi:hypothetical protein
MLDQHKVNYQTLVSLDFIELQAQNACARQGGRE